MARQKQYFYTFKAVGNPDHNQFADVASKETGISKLSVIKELAGEYIKRYNLGAGNFIGSIEGGMTISYNGRVWDKNGKEVLI